MPAELRLGEPAAPVATSDPAGEDAAGVVCRRVGSAGERAMHLAIRHRIFVEEQAVFVGSDLDSHDEEDATIAVLGFSGATAVGTVRLFLLDPDEGRWQGDRLAVLSAYRSLGVGAPLVRYAVAAAGAHGGTMMSAHIQPANVTFFRRLGWSTVGEPEVYAGLPHQAMSIGLPTPSEGLEAVRRLEGGFIGAGRSPG